MNNHRHSILFALLTTTLALPHLSAQVTHSASALNTMTCSAGTSVDSIAAGASLSPSNTMGASYFATTPFFVLLQASGTYQTTSPASGPHFSLSESCSIQSLGGGPSGTATGPNDSIWLLQSTQPVSGILTVTGTSSTSSPFNVATASIDVGNDGSIEWTLTGGTLQMAVTISGSLAIRVTTRTNAGLGTANLDVDLQFHVTGAKELYGSGCGSPLPLLLDSNNPRIGLTWTLTTSNIDPVSPFAVTFFGSRGPAVPYAALGLNGPGCWAHLASIVGSLAGANVAGSASVSIAVPNTPSLAGVQLSGQSLCLTLSNPANLISSNGLEGTIGN